MKSRHLVTIAVFLLGATLLGGVYLKLRDTQAADAENRGSDESAVVDSARTAASSTVGAAFAAGIAVPVEAARADRGTFTIRVSAEGQATALRSAPLQAEVVGSVTAVTVVEGQFVRRGQLLASVDPQVYQLDLREAQGQLEQAEDMTTATMVMADDLAFTPLEVPGFDSGMEIAGLHGDFTAEGPYTLRISFPDGYRFPAHFHPLDENFTVISGILLLAMGDTVDESQLVGYGPGDYVNVPAEHPHFGGATGYTVIQLHGIGPFEIILVEETAASKGY